LTGGSLEACANGKRLITVSVATGNAKAKRYHHAYPNDRRDNEENDEQMVELVGLGRLWIERGLPSRATGKN
jgi:hypothetical protein